MSGAICLCYSHSSNDCLRVACSVQLVYADLMHTFFITSKKALLTTYRIFCYLDALASNHMLSGRLTAATAHAR